MPSPPLSIPTPPLLSGSVHAADAPGPGDFRLGAVDQHLISPPCFFWESPEGESISLIGAAARREFAGPEPWNEAREWLRRVAESATVAGRAPGERPLAFGGFSFDGGPAAEWGFPAGIALIPALQWYRDAEGRATLTTWAPAGVGPESDEAARGVSTERGTAGHVVDEGSPDHWTRAVERALDRIQDGGVEKVVLARSRVTRAAHSWDVVRTFAALREAYPTCFRYLFWDDSGGVFLGASPERLVSLRGGRVRADAVAGTARYDGADGTEAARALLDDPKERREHEVVVREILAALRAICPDATAPPGPTLLRLRRIAHLRTLITATAAPGIHVLDLVSGLHPTPAVAGTPRDEALRIIRALERRGRGWYAGPIGWMTPEGEGDFAVGIRSAFVRGDRALLYAGAGIVAGSRPEREWEECEAKLRSIEDLLPRD